MLSKKPVILSHAVNCIFIVYYEKVYCIRIRRRGGIYGEIWPEPRGVPEGAARGNSRGFRQYFAVYPESSPNTDIISFLKVTLWPFSVLPSEVGLYWKS